MASVETGDTAAVCLSTEATKDWPHGRRVASLVVSIKGSLAALGAHPSDFNGLRKQRNYTIFIAKHISDCTLIITLFNLSS